MIQAHFSRVITSVETSDDNLEGMFKEYVNREFEERLDDTRLGMSVEDKKFINIMESSIILHDGHYVTELPFRDREKMMPNNSGQAVAYAERLKSSCISNTVNL